MISAWQFNFREPPPFPGTRFHEPSRSLKQSLMVATEQHKKQKGLRTRALQASRRSFAEIPAEQ
jgi:hypothetical protein